MAKITLTKPKGEFLNLLKGLFSVLHIKGKDFSIAVTHNILVIKEALSGYIFDIPPEDYKVLLVQFKSIMESGAEDAEEQIQAIKDANPGVLQERDAQLKEVEDALKVEITLEVEVIDKNIISEEITSENLLSINEFIVAD